jgi:hypothetical protein
MSQTDLDGAPRPAPTPPAPPAGARRHPVALAVAAALFGAAIALWLSPWLREQVLVSIVRQPTSFTELAVSDPKALPSSLPAGRPTPMPFVITNHDGTTTDYEYRVVLSGPDGAAVVADDHVTVADGQSATIAATITPPEPRTAYEVEIELVGRPEHLHVAVHT